MSDSSVWVYPTADGWQKSSYSAGDGNCVEVRARRADLVGNNRNSVVLADAGDGVVMRNSRHPEGPELRFTSNEMRAFLLGVKDGEFDELLGGTDG